MVGHLSVNRLCTCVMINVQFITVRLISQLDITSIDILGFCEHYNGVFTQAKTDSCTDGIGFNDIAWTSSQVSIGSVQILPVSVSV